MRAQRAPEIVKPPGEPMRASSSLLLFASVATAQLIVTRTVSTTAQLHAAMDDVSVGDIVVANGTYRLADEPGLGCMPDLAFPVSFSLCISRNLTIRRGNGATMAVLDGGNKKGVVLVFGGVTAYLQGVHITNGNTTLQIGHDSSGLGYAGGGILNCGTLTVFDCDVHHNFAFAGGGISNGDVGMDSPWPASYKCTTNGAGPTSPWGYGTLHVENSSVHHNSGGGINNNRDQYAGGDVRQRGV